MDNDPTTPDLPASPSASTGGDAPCSMDLTVIAQLTADLRREVRRGVVGQDEALDLMLVALLCGGHILLEGVPGTAKTLLARCFAAALSLDFGRIQFTPDLMPGDVLGTNLFNFQTNRFTLTKGPIFTQLLLADEINRTPPKTQAALLQAMQERAVTIDTESYDLGNGFMVLATQNPIEQQGTYPLPEAQLDRFLFKHLLDYPTRDQERDIVLAHGTNTSMPKVEELGIVAVADQARLQSVRAICADVRLSDELVAYIVDIVRATRSSDSLQVGASPRAASMLAAASRTFALLEGRDYVIPDDIKYLALPALRHRVVLAPGAEIEGLDADQVIRQIVDHTTAPV